MSEWISNILYDNFQNITIIPNPTDSIYKNENVSYDAYGFCIKDEELNQSVNFYESKFQPKRERRKKR